MSDLLSLPLQDNFQTTLSQKLLTTELLLHANDVGTFLFGSFTTKAVIDAGKSTMELIEITAKDTVAKTFTISARGLPLANGVAGVAYSHSVGAPVIISDNFGFWEAIRAAIASKVDESGATLSGHFKFTGELTGPSFVDVAARNAAIPAPEDGDIATVAGDLQHYNGVTAQWEIADTGTPTPNGDELAAGKFQGAIPAQQIVGTDLGSTTAHLAVMNKYVKAATTGVADAGKVVARDATGKIDPSNLPLVDTLSVTLGETVVAGNALRISQKDGKAYKCSNVPDYLRDAEGSARFGGSTMVAAGRVFTYLLDINKWLFVWENVGNNTLAMVGTLSNGVWTVGAQVPITANGSMQSYHQISILSPTKFLFTFDHSATNNVNITVCTIAGTVITVGAAAVYEVQTTNQSPIIIGTDTTGTETGICFVNDNDNAVRAKGFTIAGTVITLGVETAIETGLSLVGFPVASLNAANQVVVAYGNGATVIRAAVVNQTDGTSTITAFAPVTMFTDAGSSQEQLLQLINSSSNIHMLLWKTNSTPNLLEAGAISISGTVPSGSSQTVLKTARNDTADTFANISTVIGNSYLQSITSTDWGLVISGTPIVDNLNDLDYNSASPAAFTKFAHFLISGATFSVKWEPFLFYAPNPAIYWEQGFENTPYVLFSDTFLHSDPAIIRVYALKIDPNHFVGWAQTAGVLNDVITIDINSDSNQSGLTAGLVYNLGNNGGLQHDGVGKIAAIALSPTQVARLHTTYNKSPS